MRGETVGLFPLFRRFGFGVFDFKDEAAGVRFDACGQFAFQNGSDGGEHPFPLIGGPVKTREFGESLAIYV